MNYRNIFVAALLGLLVPFGTYSMGKKPDNKAQSSQSGQKIRTDRYNRMMEIVGRSLDKKLATRAVKGTADDAGVKKPVKKPVAKLPAKPGKKGSPKKKRAQDSDEQESSVSEGSEFRALDKMTEDALTSEDSESPEVIQNREALRRILDDQVSDVAQYGLSQDELDDIVSLARSEAGCGRSSRQSGSSSEESESSQIRCRDLRNEVESVISDVSRHGLSDDETYDIVSQAADELSSEEGSASGARASSSSSEASQSGSSYSSEESGSASESASRSIEPRVSRSSSQSYEYISGSQSDSGSKSSPRLEKVSGSGSESSSSIYGSGSPSGSGSKSSPRLEKVSESESSSSVYASGSPSGSGSKSSPRLEKVSESGSQSGSSYESDDDDSSSVSESGGFVRRVVQGEDSESSRLQRRKERPAKEEQEQSYLSYFREMAGKYVGLGK